MPPAIKTAKINGFEQAYLEQGEGPVLMMLHGFPDTAYTWRHQIPILAEAGYRVVAPFLRGYAPSAIPADGAYEFGALSADANALHEAVGGDENAVLVGHDFGAMAAYGTLNSAPERWRRAVTLGAPPVPLLGKASLDIEKMQKAFFIYLFQSESADKALDAVGWELLETLWRDWSPGFDASEELKHLREALPTQERLKIATKEYYRAMRPSQQLTYPEQHAAGTGLPTVPLLYLHGADDGCLPARLVADGQDYLGEKSEIRIVPDAGHFVQLQQPDVVNAAIIEWVGTADAPVR